MLLEPRESGALTRLFDEVGGVYGNVVAVNNLSCRTVYQNLACMHIHK